MVLHCTLVLHFHFTVLHEWDFTVGWAAEGNKYKKGIWSTKKSTIKYFNFWNELASSCIRIRTPDADPDPVGKFNADTGPKHCSEHNVTDP